MGVNEWLDGRGKLRWFVSKRWPDGSRFKRVATNKTVAKNLLKRIENSIVMGTWRELKAVLARGVPAGTVKLSSCLRQSADGITLSRPPVSA